MRHPSEGTLRRLVDEPAGVADADREHVAGCPVCLTELATVQQDARTVGAALGPDVTADVESAWRRLERATVEEAPARRVGSRTAKPAAARWRAVLRSPVVAGIGVVAVLAGAGAAAAADWLQIFSTERIQPAVVTDSELVELPDLAAYGDVEVLQEPDVRTVADLAAAESVTGLTIPEVAELPQGVTGEPEYVAGDQMSMVFTFSAAKAARAAEATGESPPPTPEGLDGSRFRLVGGPGIAAIWSEARGIPALVVARAVGPTAYSTGVPFETARDYLLSLPGIPEDVAAQLRGFSQDGATLPLPIPGELVGTSAVEVDGYPASLLESRDGTMVGVVWVEDGVINAVAGSLSADEVLTVARELP
jgi:hypothetical protein